MSMGNPGGGNPFKDPLFPHAPAPVNTDFVKDIVGESRMTRMPIEDDGMCHCGNDMKRFCMNCPRSRRDKVLAKTGRIDPHQYVREAHAPRVRGAHRRVSNKDRKRLEKELRKGIEVRLKRRITNGEFRYILNEQAAKLRREAIEKEMLAKTENHEFVEAGSAQSE